jgi:hypothetical protein
MDSMKVTYAVCSVALLVVTCCVGPATDLFNRRGKLNLPAVQSNRLGVLSADGGAPPAPPLPLPHGGGGKRTLA